MKFSHLTRLYDTSLLEKNQTITFEGDSFHYIKTVLRMRPGEVFRVFNEREGEYLAEIIDLGRNKLVIKVGELFRSATIEKPLSLAMCIIKPDRMIEAVKAAVQLGVTELIPIISERTQVKNINIEKFNKSIIQATEQCERFMVPVIHEPQMLRTLLNNINEEQLIFANEEEKNYSIKDIKQWQEKVMLLIGPEGGFTKDEKEGIKEKVNTVSISLGNTVLRTEIAAISALSCIQLLRE